MKSKLILAATVFSLSMSCTPEETKEFTESVVATAEELNEDETVLAVAAATIEEAADSTTAEASTESDVVEEELVDELLIEDSDSLAAIIDFIKTKAASNDLDWFKDIIGSSAQAESILARVNQMPNSDTLNQFIKSNRKSIAKRAGKRVSNKSKAYQSKRRPQPKGKMGNHTNARPKHECLTEEAATALVNASDINADSLISSDELAVVKSSFLSTLQECASARKADMTERRAQHEARKQAMMQSGKELPEVDNNKVKQKTAHRKYLRVRGKIMPLFDALKDKVEEESLKAFTQELRTEMIAIAEAKRSELQEEVVIEESE